MLPQRLDQQALWPGRGRAVAGVKKGTSWKVQTGTRGHKAAEMGPWADGQGHGEAPVWLGRDSDVCHVQSVCRHDALNSAIPCGNAQDTSKLCKTTVSFHVAYIHYGFFSLLQLPVCRQQF